MAARPSADFLNPELGGDEDRPTAYPLEELASEQIALVCKASADAFRVEILRVLQRDSFGVLELSDIFGVRQSAMSHHLKILVVAGLIEHKRQANSNFYRRAVVPSDDSLLDLKQQIYAAVDATELSHDLAQAMARVHHSRAQQSREFFNRHAGQFSEINDLIAGYDQYADIIQTVMEPLPLGKDSVGMEVGPGEGGFLEPLAQRFHHVYALDNSGPMLELARRYLQDSVTNIRFILGDTQSALRDGLQLDFIAFNMVMHHNPSPKELLGDSAALLKAGGFLLITELCPHNQQWVMESCGDLWLGLAPGQLQAWGQQAGLTHQQQVITGLRNGFQIQVQLFLKT